MLGINLDRQLPARALRGMCLVAFDVVITWVLLFTYWFIAIESHEFGLVREWQTCSNCENYSDFRTACIRSWNPTRGQWIELHSLADRGAPIPIGEECAQPE
jgi:hypothetical protein